MLGTAENANDYIKKILNTSIRNIEEVSADDNAVTVNINNNNEEKVYYYNVPKGTIKQIELAKNSTNKNDSYVGCYADIDEDGIVDGTIFADLLAGSIRDTQEWGSNGNGKYTLPINVIIKNVKKYYISQERYTDSLQDNQDILKHIQEKYKKSWFIPSKAEWSAFANELGTETPVTTSSCGLSKYYWTSSQVVERNFWYADLQPDQGIFYYYWAQGAYAVRLATTF